MSNQKSELTWAAKKNLPKQVLRVLPVGTAKPYQAKHRVADNDLLDEVET